MDYIYVYVICRYSDDMAGFPDKGWYKYRMINSVKALKGLHHVTIVKHPSWTGLAEAYEIDERIDKLVQFHGCTVVRGENSRSLTRTVYEVTLG